MEGDLRGSELVDLVLAVGLPKLEENLTSRNERLSAGQNQKRRTVLRF